MRRELIFVLCRANSHSLYIYISLHPHGPSAWWVLSRFTDNDTEAQGVKEFIQGLITRKRRFLAFHVPPHASLECSHLAGLCRKLPQRGALGGLKKDEDMGNLKRGQEATGRNM